MTDKKYISWRVIARRLLDKATREECEQVEAWLKESEENKIYYRKAKRYFDIYYTGAEDRSVDMERAWEEFLRYTDKVQKRVEWKKWMRIVAAVFLPLLIVGGVFWYSGKKDVEDVKVAQSVSIGPGKIKAVLQVVSGAEITLSDTVNVVQMARQINERQEKSAGAPLQEDASIKYNTIIVPKGGEYSLALADGTRIVLNSDSRLRFPEYFGKNGRGVFLEGEAYFDVAHNDRQPFVVRTFASDITVLGTEFNVNADKGAGLFSVALIEGSISLSNYQNPGEQIVMHPNEKVFLERGHLIFKEYEASKDIQWTEGILDISGLDFSELMRKLEMAFGVRIVVEREMPSGQVFANAKLRMSDGIDKAFEVIGNGTDFTYHKDYRTGTIFIR